MDVGTLLSEIVNSDIRTEFHWGVITNVVTSPAHSVSLTLSGSSTVLSGIKYLKSYSPSISDVVLVLISRKDMVVLGELQ
jgi:hypothetical protein